MSNPPTQTDQSAQSSETTQPSGFPVLAALIGIASAAHLLAEVVKTTTPNPAAVVYVPSLLVALLVLYDYRRRRRLAARDD